MSTSKLNQKQLLQLKNISDTLIEATEHLTKNITQREFAQSIQIFSTIVEGYQAIHKTLKFYKNDLIEEIEEINLLNKIESNLALIANHFEHKKLLKVTEIVQFSLMPNLRKLNKALILKSSSKPKPLITIGVYFDKANPREVYTKERINALLKESKKQNTKIIFFSSKDIDFERKKYMEKCLIKVNGKE